LGLRKAAAIQWIGVGLVFMGSVVTPPFAHAMTGTAGPVQWVIASGEGFA
jgi:hypothetical protein